MLFRHTSKPSCLAYLVTCWVELPDEAWHPCANRHKFRRPVCRLVKALYGHPDAGTMWEQHCHTAVEKVGFKPLGDEWPSLYFHPDLKLLLVIYVDDLKMAGPGLPLPRAPWESVEAEQASEGRQRYEEHDRYEESGGRHFWTHTKNMFLHLRVLNYGQDHFIIHIYIYNSHIKQAPKTCQSARRNS